MFNSQLIQPKLKVSQPEDVYEQDADRVTEQVMRMPAPKDSAGRKCSGCQMENEEEMQISRKSDTEENLQVSDYAAQQIEGVKGGGQPLDESTKNFMESRFGFDFSKVRIHDDERASRFAKSVNARAFTIGNDVVFGKGEDKLTTKEGKMLLSHELVHVIQQSSTTQTGSNRMILSRSSTQMIQRQQPKEEKLPARTPSSSRPEKTVIVIGSPSPDQKYQLQFATAAECRKHDENTIWLVEKTGYELYGIPLDYFEKYGPPGGLGWITPQNGLVDWLDHMPDGSIGNLIVFSHGLPGHVTLRYGWNEYGIPDYGLDLTNVARLMPIKFAPAAKIEFNSCNTGTETTSGNLAQKLAKQVGHPVNAWVGRTSYAGINRGTCAVGPSEYVLGGDFFTEFWNRWVVRDGSKPHMETFNP